MITAHWRKVSKLKVYVMHTNLKLLVMMCPWTGQAKDRDRLFNACQKGVDPLELSVVLTATRIDIDIEDEVSAV